MSLPAARRALAIRSWAFRASALFAILCLHSDDASAARAYTISGVTIDARLSPDGHVQVEESHTFVLRYRVSDPVRRHQDAARRERLIWVPRIMILASILALVAWLFIYQRYGRRSLVPVTVELDAGIPTSTPPALVGYLLHGREVCPRDMVATILDLARRGFVRVREEPVEKRRLLGGTRTASRHLLELDREILRVKAVDLLPFEAELIRHLFDDMAGGTSSLELEGIRKEGPRFRRFFRSWRKEVQRAGSRREYYDRESLRGRNLSWILGGATLVAALGSIFLFGPWAVILAATGGGIMVLGFLVMHRTPRGETEARQWRALKRHLRRYDVRRQGHAPLVSGIDVYLVYGLAMGLGSKVYERLLRGIPIESVRQVIPWYACAGGQGAAVSPDAFAAGFSSMVSEITSSFRSAAGLGGGASGGGGGGAGGGGGGAG